MLEIESLTKIFPGHRGGGRVLAVDDISFEIPEGHLFTLLGPSGCGKTTTLRCVAGLEVPDAGEIRLASVSLFSSRDHVFVPPDARGLGMVVQSYGIWPHMTVWQNAAFPLLVGPRQQRPSKNEVRRKVEEVLAIVRLDHLAGRPAPALSGGQQQRLALARALVMEPPLLLLDEPLSNLDAKLRKEMRLELNRLQREIGITTLYVTHDQKEALAISNTIAVMNEGRIEQIGSPREIYAHPVSRFVADFIGRSNILQGVVEGRTGSRLRIATSEGILETEGAALANGSLVDVVVRPEQLRIVALDGSPGPNRWRGKVVTAAFLGESTEVVVSVGKLILTVRSDPASALAVGDEVVVEFPIADAAIIVRHD